MPSKQAETFSQKSVNAVNAEQAGGYDPGTQFHKPVDFPYYFLIISNLLGSKTFDLDHLINISPFDSD